MTLVNEQTYFQDLLRRPRRNRKSAAVRSLVQESRLHPSDFILPVFVCEGVKISEAITTMPGVFRQSSDLILKQAEEAVSLGIPGIILFPAIDSALKDSRGSDAYRTENLVNRTVAALKREFPQLCVIVDAALDPYTDHGHDGLVNEQGEILNDETVEALARQALASAAAGADVIAPSDMMDGRIGYLRRVLDGAGFSHVSLLAYAAKYASAFYFPFREALRSAPKFGDKKTYQMDPANVREALLECALDEQEGADLLLVKPGLPYLDVLAKVKEATNLPVGAFHVSGEYSLVMAAAQLGWADADKLLHESLIAFKRAGADFIISYAAMRVSKLIRNN